MSNSVLVSIQPAMMTRRMRNTTGKIMLVKPPYFTPWTPPLGIAILKSFLEQHDFSAKCFDFNVDPELWGMHHKYFAALQTLEDVSINDGYSKLWWILNAHMLAYANDADQAGCAKVLETIIPLYGIRCERSTIDALLPLVEKFFSRLEHLTDQIDLTDFAVVGTSTYTTSLAASLFVLKKVKQKYPHLITVMGGGIFADDLALGSDNLTTLIENYPYVDHVILGEGEMLLLKLLEGQLSHRRVISLADLKGATLEMKDVPIPDFSDLDQEVYYHLTIEGARSCPFQCSFCSETIQWGDYRKKPTDIFVGQVMALSQKYKNSAFFMGDSLMNPYINPFAKELIEQRANIVYDGYLRADKPVANRKFVKMWADSGLYRVRLGIESAAARVLDSMDKMTTPQVISEVLKALAGMGIRTTTYWIVGFPGETEEDFRETCDFIEEHHQFIYELEAHPYYYYPYGQIGSRLYRSRSLYPQEVTDIINFKVWDIEDASPTREVRYDRLRRLSKLAADLGLPNIYTMAERYKAEERWLKLHPLAREVYEGTQIRRAAARPSGSHHKASSEASNALPGKGGASPADSVLCYRVVVKKKLDEDMLLSSIARLIQYNEMLQMSLVDGASLAAPEGSFQQSDKLLSIIQHQAENGDAFAATRSLIKGFSAEMRPERGNSIRVALANNEDDAAEIYLLVHRAIADGRSVVLLVEDLFRIYEQLANHRDVSLAPVSRSYGEFIESLTAENEVSTDIPPRQLSPALSFAQVGFTHTFSNRTEDSRSKIKSTSVRFDQKLARRIFSRTLERAGVKAADIIIQALLKSLAKTSKDQQVQLNLQFDYRCIDPNLASTLGPLNRITKLSQEILSERFPLFKNAGRASELKALLSIDSEAAAARLASNDLDSKRAVLLNLEYLTQEPWLGGDQWVPHGFIVNESDLRAGYGLEISPFKSNAGVEVQFKFEDELRIGKIVEAIKDSLVREAELALRHYETYVSAKQYWLHEFGKGAPQSNLEIENVSAGSESAEIASTAFKIGASLIEKMEAERAVEESVIIVASFALLLSRLSGRQDVPILSSVDSKRGRQTFPLRLYPLWSSSFKEFLREVEQKLSLSSRHAAHAFEILNDEALLSSESLLTRPLYDIGYIFQESGEEEEGLVAFKSLSSLQAPERKINLVLSALRKPDGLSLRFIYPRSAFSQQTINKLRSYLDTIFVEVAGNMDLALGEIPLESKKKVHAASDVLVGDVFDFG